MKILDTHRDLGIIEPWDPARGMCQVRIMGGDGHPKHPDLCPYFPSIEKAKEFIDILQDKKAEHRAAKAS